MSSQNLIDRLLQSPLGKDIERKAEEERIAERRKCREEIDVAERKHGAAMERLAAEIDEAEKEHGKLQKKFTASSLALNKLGAERRIAAIDFDRVIAVQTDRLKESVHPNVPAAIDACWKKLNELKGESGERKSKPNIWGVVTHAFWSNARSVDGRKTTVRKVLEKLQGMELQATEGEGAEVVRLMNSLPTGPLESIYDEERYEPAARRLTRYPSRSARA